MKYEKGTFIVVPNIEVLRGKSAQLQALFMWICSYADKNGQCFPSRSRLAKDISVGIRTIDKYLEELKTLGLILIENRKEGAKNLTSLYQVMILEGVVQPIPQSKRRTRVVQQMHEGSATDAGGVVRQLPTELYPIGTQYTEPNNIIPELTLSIEQETNKVIDMFSILNKDYLTFFEPGAQRTSVKKLIKFAKDDGLIISDLIQMAKNLHGVEYAPQIFTPSDMVSKYSKLLASGERRTRIVLPVGTTYTKGKFSNDKGHAFSN